MGSKNKKRHLPEGFRSTGSDPKPVEPDRPPRTAEDNERSHRELVKGLSCPACGANYTDRAFDWYLAWSEGRFDLLKELRLAERDGREKVRCEACGRRAWIGLFSDAVTLDESGRA